MANKDSTKETGSRYASGGDTTSFSNRLGWWERNVYPSDDSDIEYVIPLKYDKRPDLLARDVYGKSTFMWIVLQYNTITDINEEFISGKTITLPDPSRVNYGLIS